MRKFFSIALSFFTIAALAPALAAAKTTTKAPKSVTTPWIPTVEDDQIILKRKVGFSTCTVKRQRGVYIFRIERETTWMNPVGLSLGIEVLEPWSKPHSTSLLNSDLKDYYRSYIVSPRERNEMYIMAACGTPSQQMVAFMKLGHRSEKKKEVANKK